MSVSEIHIRHYTPEDEQAVITLWQECNLTKPWNNPQADIKRKIQDSPELFLVGTADGRIVATAMGSYDGHRGWVYYLAVASECRKRGYGRRMMKAVEGLLIEKGCPKINLMIRSSNREVVQFYKSIGYDKEDTILMSRRLITDEPYM